MKRSRKRIYYAILKPAVEGGFDVSFPDFPGCVTFGRTFEEAQTMATEVLELWLEELAVRGESTTGSTEQPMVTKIVAAPPRPRSGGRHAALAG